MSQSVGEADITDELRGFLDTYYRDEIGVLAQHYPKEQQSLVVDWTDIHQHNMDYAEDILNHPEQALRYLDEALATYDLPVDIDLNKARVRVTNLPTDKTYNVGGCSPSASMGKLVEFNAQVEKVGKTRPQIVEAVFECQRCGITTTIPQQGRSFNEPDECQGCQRQGPFRVLDDKSVFRDHQLVRVAQPPEQAAGGETTSSDVNITEDLVGAVDPGDRVNLVGTFKRGAAADEEIGTYETFVDAESVTHEETDYGEIDISEHKDLVEEIAAGEHGDPYDLLVGSVNPGHYGDEHIKLAIGLQMFGGWRRDSIDERGDSHILLLGDPGTGKSSFLRYVDKIAPRSTYASGKGASAAGVTAAAVPDEFGSSKWSLEAGALVVADKGVACVDEIDKIDEDAVSSMHDALEGQQVHVNKAGFNTDLPARTSLLAAGNPKYGRFDPYESIGDQIDLGPTLLSRFDLMFMVTDEPDADTDRAITDHKIRSRQVAGQDQQGDDVNTDDIEPDIEPEVLRAYVAHAKRNCYPTIEDDEVVEHLRDSFAKLRLSNGDADDAPIPVTFRKLEAIQRLAEASARVRLSETVDQQDVERAMNLVGRSMRDVGMDEDSNQFDADIVETGSSKSQKEKIKTVLGAIEELQGRGENAQIADLKRGLESEGFTANEVEMFVGKLKDKGEIYSPAGEEGLRSI